MIILFILLYFGFYFKIFLNFFVLAYSIKEINSIKKYKLWHDRATFHFLIDNKQINTYKTLVNNHVSGFMCIGTFSKNGPLKCSGLEIKQYTSDSLLDTFNESFELTKSIIEDHKTPFDTFQNFVFCGFKRK